jgi:hypothetical protein
MKWLTNFFGMNPEYFVFLGQILLMVVIVMSMNIHNPPNILYLVEPVVGIIAICMIISGVKKIGNHRQTT